MSILTRTEIIAEARIRAGRKAQAISLNYAYDFILQKMTRDYPLLPHIEHVGSTVEDQGWVWLPADYRNHEQMFYGDTELDWMEPEEYVELTRTGSTTSGTPYAYTVVEDEARIYLINTPSEAEDIYFYYTAIHPRANKALSFTSGGTYQTKRGNTVTGATSAQTMVVDFVIVTSGSWEGGSAAGRLLGTPSGTFQAENLNVGAETNVATIAADAATADNFQHFLGEKFDEVIIEGVTWRCLELISDKSAEDRLVAREQRAAFEGLLFDAALVKGNRELRTQYRGF